MANQMPDNSNDKTQVSAKVVVQNKPVKENRTLQIILGFLFILPALAALIFFIIIPTIRTIGFSFQEATLFESQPVGWANYERMLETPILGQALSFTLLLTFNRVLIVLIPPLILALGSSAFKTGLRKVIRVLVSLPWMVYSPTALGIAWLFIINPYIGFGTQTFSIANPDWARWIVLLLDGLSFLGLACGLCLTVYLSTMRGVNSEGEKKGLWRNLLILAIILLIGTAAISLQGGDTINLLTYGGPENTTLTLQALIQNTAFVRMQMGMASAIATPIFIIVAVFGLVTCLITILANVRLFQIPKETGPAPIAKWLRIIAVILMIFILLIILISIVPYIVQLVPILRAPGEGFFQQISEVVSNSGFWRSLLNTWYLPVLIVLLIQFPVTYLAAVGISALRPLGKASKWLLLLFAPWLFVRVLLYLPGITRTMLDMELMNRPVGFALAHIINIPLLFILTLFFRGQHQKIAKEGKPIEFFKTYILPSIPLAAFGFVVSLMFIQQDLLWSVSTNTYTLPVYFRRLRGTLGANIGGFGGLMWLLRIPAFVVSLIFFGGFQLFFLPRIGIQTGKKER